MRGVSRGAAALSLVVMLSLAAQAARNFEDRRERSWLDFQRERIVKVVKRVVKSFGDGTVPTP
ncbi:MAG TPA: hypothetical protein VEK79_01515 [Thermoanaerobaculia bacterium]|nr:hypothetical protein [Thermoanaerobaculia bacterium]